MKKNAIAFLKHRENHVKHKERKERLYIKSFCALLSVPRQRHGVLVVSKSYIPQPEKHINLML
jgi:hypothetical protein